jgi:phosphoribosylaminoimidazolecarboxamide formyltransferase/IMP cyclohydrolase
VIVKHASPCGIASSGSVLEAYKNAYKADSESAFGGIIGINRSLDAESASSMISNFIEVIVASEVLPEAKEVVSKKPNVRLVELKLPNTFKQEEWHSVLGGWLVQACDNKLVDEASLKIVTKRKPGKEELADLHFAWACVKHVKSNAIVIAKGRSSVGIGQGQPSRVRAVRLAINNAEEKSKEAVLASDGFFPFPDNIEFAAKAGIKAIIQPGGSIKDKEVIEAADKAGLTMIFTGMRHFRH